MDEILAQNTFEKIQGKSWIYQGDDQSFQGSQGVFSILEDMNCCAPTLDVLYAFSTGTRRKVMPAREFLEFLKQCQEAGPVFES